MQVTLCTSPNPRSATLGIAYFCSIACLSIEIVSGGWLSAPLIIASTSSPYAGSSSRPALIAFLLKLGIFHGLAEGAPQCVEPILRDARRAGGEALDVALGLG